MPPIISTSGLYRRETSSALDLEAATVTACAAGKEMMPKASGVGYDPKTSINKSVLAMANALALTQSRVDYLWSVYGDVSSFINQDTLFVIWQINASRHDFSLDWLDIVINKGIIDTNFPKLIVDAYLSRIKSVDITNDELAYRWVKNLFGILIGFSDWSEPFKDALAEAGAVEPLIAYITDSSQLLDDIRSSSKGRKGILLEFVLKLIFNLASTGNMKVQYARLIEPYFMPRLADTLLNRNVSVIAMMCSARIEATWPEVSKMDPALLQLLFDYFQTALDNDDRRYQGIAVFELAECIRRLTLSDADKELMIRKNVLRIILRPLLYSTDVVEQRCGVDFLYAICSSTSNECSAPCLAVIEDNEDCIQPLQWMAVRGDAADLKHHAKRFLDFLNDRVAILTGQLYAKLTPKKQNSKTEALRGVLGTSLVLKEKPTVYISCYKGDVGVVKQVRRLLMSSGLKVVNGESLTPDKSFDMTTIEEGLSKADTVAICYSQDYYLSKECRREVDVAASYQKKFFSVRIDLNFELPQQEWLSQLIASRSLLNIDNDESPQQIEQLKQLASKLVSDM